MIINCNIKHYSKLENSPFGLGTFLCDTLGSYEILDFTDRILARKLTEEDEKLKILLVLYLPYKNYIIVTRLGS